MSSSAPEPQVIKLTETIARNFNASSPDLTSETTESEKICKIYTGRIVLGLRCATTAGDLKS